MTVPIVFPLVDDVQCPLSTRTSLHLGWLASVSPMPDRGIAVRSRSAPALALPGGGCGLHRADDVSRRAKESEAERGYAEEPERGEARVAVVGREEGEAIEDADKYAVLGCITGQDGGAGVRPLYWIPCLCWSSWLVSC